MIRRLTQVQKPKSLVVKEQHAREEWVEGVGGEARRAGSDFSPKEFVPNSDH